MPRVLVVGSANVDVTVAVARLPQPGETVSGGTLLVNHGGKGANQAVAARRLGAEVRLIAKVGDDASGRDIRAALAGQGIGVDGVTTSASAATGTAVIVVDAEGRNMIAVAPGANRVLSVDDVRARAVDLGWAEIVLCQLETPLDTVRWALAAARQRGLTTVLNPAPVPELPLDFLGDVDYLTPNAGEAARLAGVQGPDDAARALRQRGARCTIVTLGERGAVAQAGDGTWRAPGVRVDAIDTTAAGDCFNAALAVALTERRGLSDALRFANAAAALACTKRGAQASLPARAEVEALLARA